MPCRMTQDLKHRRVKICNLANTLNKLAKLMIIAILVAMTEILNSSQYSQKLVSLILSHYVIDRYIQVTLNFSFLLLVHVQTIPEDDSYKRKAQEVHSGSEQADPRFVSANYT